MVRTAYLRVYQPLDSFPEEERSRWSEHRTASAEAEAVGDAPTELSASRRWLLSGALPESEAIHSLAEGAFVRTVDKRVFVCPWRTRLRMLAGLIAFRGSVPEEVAEQFVPAGEARRAALELESMGERYPEVRSHILHANWHVPLRWFAAFEDSERILTEDSDGLRIRYEASLVQAAGRLERALDVLEASWMDEAVTGAVRELKEWLEDFPSEGIVELDYGSVARMFVEDELVEDHTAASVGLCLEALSTGDVVHAGRIFGALSDRWADLRAQEVVN